MGGYVPHMEEISSAHKILIVKSERKTWWPCT